jgi:hypothetical protein
VWLSVGYNGGYFVGYLDQASSTSESTGTTTGYIDQYPTTISFQKTSF